MAYDEGLAHRIREHFDSNEDVVEKKMFGGLAFMLGDHMCCGIVDEQLMARIGKEAYAAALSEPHVSEMAFTGKPLSGFVYVSAEGIAEDADLDRWIERCAAFVASLPPK